MYTVKITDFHNPSFAQMPVNNLRTGWKPISVPIILVVPNRINGLGYPIENSDIQKWLAMTTLASTSQTKNSLLEAFLN